VVIFGQQRPPTIISVRQAQPRLPPAGIGGGGAHYQGEFGYRQGGLDRM
jgi:hypothetical protein